MNIRQSKKIFSLLILFCMFSGKIFAQDNAAAIANADTTNYTVNDEEGWQLFNSYLGVQGTDSVVLEVIVQHDNTLTWTQEQYIGRVKTDSLRPSVTQTVLFELAATQYSLKVQSDGKCYLKLLTGPPPGASPAILPIRIRYKK